MDKPDCYKCKYRGTVPGSRHSSCNHPAYEKANADPIAQILGIFASVRRVAPIQVKGEGIEIKGNARGIRKGWFNHPFNFDPTWLESCNGFKEKEVKP